MCYQKHVLTKHQLEPLSEGRIACTKKCYEKAMKMAVDGDDGRKGGWLNDGIHGPEDPNTSMKILLDWWMEEGNYSKYCGKNNDGVKKKQFCDILAQKMSKETLSSRDSKSVKSKIEHLERAWRKAHDFATSATGAGIQENDGVEKFEELVKKRCPFYYDLLDIMQDRASSKPKVTNYELEGDIEDEENEDVDLGIDEDGEDCDNVSAFSTTSKTTTRSSASKRPASAIKSVSSASKKGKVSRRRMASSPALDDELSAAIGDANLAAQHCLSEMERHHKAVLI